jgi:DNA-binding transcriptional regulator YiaG
MTPEEIKQLRTGLGLTQAELAQKIGTQKPRVCDWEKGKHKPGKAFVILMNQLKSHS